MLDMALTVELPTGRRCVPDGTSDVVVEIPDWNRNLVSSH